MSKYDEAMGALKRAAEGDDEDAKKAKKALKAIEDDGKEPDGDEGKEPGAEEETEEEKKAKAKAAEEDEEKKKAAARRAGARPSASSSPEVVALAARVHELEAERAQEKEDAKRAQLLASRPDFSDTVRATLAKAPMPVLEDAVKTWPKIASRAGALGSAAAALAAGGTRGAGQVNEEASALSAEETAAIDERMGLKAVAGGVKRDGRHFEISTMTPEAARAALKARAAGGGATTTTQPPPGNGNGARMAAEDLE